MDPACGSISLSAEPLDCCLNPCAQIACAALVNGDIELHSYAVSTGAPGDEDNPVIISSFLQERFAAHAPSKAGDEDEDDDEDGLSCRAVSFMGSGEQLLAGYSDSCIKVFDLTKGKCVATYDDAHEDKVSRLLCVSEQVFASGDETGEVTLWDMRSKAKVYSYNSHKDYISDFALHDDGRSLVAVSGDGTLSVHDTAVRKAKHRSEDDADDELLSVAVVKRGGKVVCGTTSGVLNIYSWGAMNDCSDRFPGHPEAVQALIRFDDDTLLTGSIDGAVRIVGMLPNKLLGILGEHAADGFPIERLALSADRRVLASASHDATLKLWDLSLLHDDDGDDEDGDDEGDEGEYEAGEGEEEADEAALGQAVAEALAARKRKQRDAASLSDDSDGGDDDGEDDEDEDGDEDEEGPSQGSGQEEEEAPGGAAGPGPSSTPASSAKQQGAKGGVKPTLAQKMGSPTGGGGGGDDDDEDSDGDSDGEMGGKKRRQRDGKREKTKWTKGSEQRKRPASSNFFADLL